MKDYDIDIHCQPKIENVVAYALSRKMAYLLVLITGEVRVLKDFKQANVAVMTEGVIVQLA